MKRDAQQFVTHKAFMPLAGTELQEAAERLFAKYLSTFRGAPEAAYILRSQFFDRDYDKEYLQKNIFFVPRADYLWFFKYATVDRFKRYVELKKRSADRFEMLVETLCLTIEYRGVVEIVYTRFLRMTAAKLIP